MSYTIGVDAGTEGARAFIFDPEGRPVGSGASGYHTELPAPGQAEQNPEDWWTAIGDSVRMAVKRAGVNPETIRAIGFDTTACTVVALDRTMRPLRPALIWMDVRASREAADVLETNDPALVINSAGKGPVSAEWMIPKALWLKRHDRENYDRAHAVCDFIDYVNYRSTGRYTGSGDTVSMRWHYVKENGGRPDSLLKKLDLEELVDKWPPEIIFPGDVVGELTSEAARHMGLNGGIPVVQGGADAFIGMIGLGVKQPGQMALVTGSSHLQLVVSDRPIHKQGLWGSYADCVYRGDHILEGGQTSTGSILKWFTTNLCPNLDYKHLDLAASKIAPGSDELLVLDHFQGNRTPFTDPNSRGAVVGLCLAHTTAHVYRAVIEGICFGTEAILRTIQDDGFKVEEAMVCGGATKSPLWLQIHADVSGLPLRMTEVADAPALGSAILAAFGAGIYGSVREAIEAMVHFKERIDPDPKRHAAYREIYEAYSRLYPATRQIRRLRKRRA
jgi:ribulokinase